MKKLFSIAALIFAMSSIAQDVNVRGYTRSDGTYVQPHTRSAPDAYEWNNYGRPANDRQEQQYNMRDYDSDSLYNQFDRDDDNDGYLDDYDSY